MCCLCFVSIGVHLFAFSACLVACCIWITANCSRECKSKILESSHEFRDIHMNLLKFTWIFWVKSCDWRFVWIHMLRGGWADRTPNTLQAPSGDACTYVQGVVWVDADLVDLSQPHASAHWHGAISLHHSISPSFGAPTTLQHHNRFSEPVQPGARYRMSLNWLCVLLLKLGSIKTEGIWICWKSRFIV